MPESAGGVPKTVKTGDIRRTINDQELQTLAMETLLSQSKVPEALKMRTEPGNNIIILMKPEYIAGIIAAERSRWHLNDDFPSIPDRWASAFFAMSLPIKGIAEMDDAGWGAAGVFLTVLASNPAGWATLAGAAVGVAVIEVGLGAVGFLTKDLNSTVGRGQIGKALWDDTVAKGKQKIEVLTANYPINL